MTTTEETTTTPLVNVAAVIDRVRVAAKAEYLRLDPQYRWTPETVAEMLTDLGEPVYSFQGMFLVDEDVAEKLFSFSEDFLIPQIGRKVDGGTWFGATFVPDNEG